MRTTDNTSFVTIYDTALTFNATADVGSFSGSLVQPFLKSLQEMAPQYPYTILPYSYYGIAYTLFLDPLLGTISEPVHCPGGDPTTACRTSSWAGCR